MWVRQVELHNIKSYGQRTKIDLTPGVNAICGRNGAGKSTILEAIGYALFNKSAYRKQDQFINETEKQGEIVITVLDHRDERLYQVVRPIKRGTPYVFDPETKSRLAEGASDVQRWLCDCMGVEPATDLEALFENAVGVPQGLLTASFLLTEARRRAIFDPLLGVEAYKKVFDNMRAVVNHVKDLQQANETDQARLTGQLTDFPTLRAEAEDLAKKIKANETNYKKVTKTLTTLEEKLGHLQGQKEAIQTRETQHKTAITQAKGLQDQLEEAEQMLAQAGAAKEILDRCLADYNAYEAAHQKQDALEKRGRTRDEIQKRLTEVDSSLGLIRQALETLAGQLQRVEEAEAQLVDLKPALEKQAALEQDRQKAQNDVATLQTAQQRVSEETERLEGWQKDLIAIQSQLDRRKDLTGAIETLQQQRNDQAAALDSLNQEIKALQTQLAAVQQALSEAQTRLQTYETLTERIEETEAAQIQGKRDLAKMQAELTERSALEAEFEGLAKIRQDCRAELSALAEQIDNRETAERQAQTDLNRWQSQVQRLEDHQQTLLTAEVRLAEAEITLAELEAGFAQRQQLAEQIGHLEREQGEAEARRDAIKDTVSRHQNNLAAIAEARQSLAVEADSPCPVCQKPLTDHDITTLQQHYQADQEQTQTALETATAELKQTETDLKRIRRQITHHRTNMEQLPTQTHLKAQQTAVSTAAEDVTGLKQQVAEMAGAPEQVAVYEQVLQQTQTELAELKKQQKSLQDADLVNEDKQNDIQSAIGQLARQADIDRLQNEAEQRQANLARWQTDLKDLAGAPERVAELKVDQKNLEGQRADQDSKYRQITAERETLANEIQTLQTEMNDLATPARAEELQATLETQRVVVNDWQEQVETLAEAPAHLEAVEKALADLGDPQSAYSIAQAEAAKGPQLEAEQAQKQAALKTHHQLKAGIEAELAPFADLDDAIAQTKETLKTTQEAHQTYLEHRATAGMWPQRQARLEDLQTQIETMTQEINHLQRTLNQAKEAYDTEDHAATQTELEAARTERTRLETRLEGDYQNLKARQAKIIELEEIDLELSALKQEAEQLERLSEVVGFIRRTIRDAGPEVTKRLVKAISHQADQIFADIMADHQVALTWDETYAITVEKDGYARDFQQLSGGEAMAAALAVRLALLQGMSAVDVAFFDEPTANLDPERRANLAQQIARIKGFSQLVVISHDDTFEQDTGHVIHIGKDEEGYSQVMG